MLWIACESTGSLHHELRLARHAVHVDRAVVGPDDGRDDGQAQPGAAAPAGPRRITAGEPLEDLGLQPGRYPRTVVGDRQHGTPAIVDVQRRGDRGAGRGVGPGVGEQIDEHLLQPGFVADDDDGLVGQIQQPLVVGPGDVGVADRVDGEPGQVDLLAFQRPPGVQPRQQQHVLDELRHPVGLGFDAAHRMGHVVGELVSFALRQFGIAADRRQWGAQFVAGVGDELPHPGLAGVPRGQCARDAVEHPVQRRAELADLGVRGWPGPPSTIGVGSRHLTAVELEVRPLRRAAVGNP